MNRHIKLNYLYRDASNYKQWGSIIFLNPRHIPLDEIDRILKSNFEEECFFIAHQLGIPELFPYASGSIDEDDHCYHEYFSVEEITLDETETPSQSVTNLLTVAHTEHLKPDEKSSILPIGEPISSKTSNHKSWKTGRNNSQSWTKSCLRGSMTSCIPLSFTQGLKRLAC
ncbi:MAG TPA: hypothetical protein VN367_00940 [Chlorobaculum sp.]|nr:hypothetical protein [Chlorobaculum sp.]